MVTHFAIVHVILVFLMDFFYLFHSKQNGLWLKNWIFTQQNFCLTDGQIIFNVCQKCLKVIDIIEMGRKHIHVSKATNPKFMSMIFFSEHESSSLQAKAAIFIYFH